MMVSDAQPHAAPVKGILLIVAALALFAAGWMSRHWAYSSPGWRETQGTILTSVDGTSGAHRKSVVGKVSYAYRVSGTAYVGKRISYIRRFVPYGVTGSYPIGRELSVKYDPGNPSRCVLIAGGEPSVWTWQFAFGIPMLIAGVGVNRQWWQRRRSKRWLKTESEVDQPRGLRVDQRAGKFILPKGPSVFAFFTCGSIIWYLLFLVWILMEGKFPLSATVSITGALLILLWLLRCWANPRVEVAIAADFLGIANHYFSGHESPTGRGASAWTQSIVSVSLNELRDKESFAAKLEELAVSSQGLSNSTARWLIRLLSFIHVRMLASSVHAGGMSNFSISTPDHSEDPDKQTEASMHTACDNTLLEQCGFRSVSDLLTAVRAHGPRRS
jgi:hypothetical protein